jgi:hypothetical protein
MKKSSVTVGVSLLAVFLSGAVVGAFGHRLYMVRSVIATVPEPPRPSPEEFRRKYVDELRTRLNLDDGQLAKLNGILDATRERFQQMREHSKERSKTEAGQIRLEQRNQIRAMLRPDQLPEYEKVLQEREKERQKVNRKP